MADLAVICGATGGLGTAIVDVFARRGDQVIAVARSRGEVSKLQDKYPGIVRGDTADLTSRLEVDELWGRIDAIGTPRWLVNATGGFKAGKVVDTNPDDYTGMINLNLGTAWWGCRAGARRMLAGGKGGAIANVSSRSGVTADGGAAAYAIAKAGVIKLTEVLATELKGSGVRVNAVIPSIIDTPANRKSMPEKLLEKAVLPADIAQVIGFLCSDAANAITGVAVPVYGKG
ncbi:MAG: SDR family oxidoreductase [Candidatus Dormibacteraeota bacterium]|nr:SDR family oxidoreductase [Candidatus Dormibacteraeota bacterium]